MTEQTHERANPMTQPNMPPPDLTPGFYPDSQGAMRLWDGQRWTDITRPMPQAATPPLGQPGYYPDPQGVMRWWTGRDWAVSFGVVTLGAGVLPARHDASYHDDGQNAGSAMLHGLGPSALAFGVMSDKRLALFAISALGFVAAILAGFWLVLGLAD
jgi:hypothetical protein